MSHSQLRIWEYTESEAANRLGAQTAVAKYPWNAPKRLCTAHVLARV